LFHSDGVIETMNSENQFFGSQRLKKLVEDNHRAAAGELADIIFREVDWFAQSAAPADDRTLVVLKVR
jgi:serine phosphatase RsbU (regulator of sigma subunit)